MENLNLNYTKIAAFGLLGIFLVFMMSTLISFSNSEIELRNTFEQKFQERTAFYDKMSKVFNQKSQIAVKNDSSFRKNIDIIMSGRKDSEQVMMKWITETNPNANYGEVAALYKDLSRAIEAQREGFFGQEKVLQDVIRQHKNLIQRFPNSLYNLFFGRQPLIYRVIQSSITEEIIKTSTDNNTKLDL
jgi:hypothetical protein